MVEYSYGEAMHQRILLINEPEPEPEWNIGT